MHNLEPFYKWRDNYISEEDERSPLYGREYDEFQYSQKIYNYFIHPQWDNFGSNTLYLKVIYADYDKSFAIIELIGEWNDCLNNDIMFFMQNIIDPLMKQGLYHFILIGENVLNFHASDDCYYEEWYESVLDYDGWIVGLNFREHVVNEMNDVGLDHYLLYGNQLSDINWRPLDPKHLFLTLESLMMKRIST